MKRISVLFYGILICAGQLGCMISSADRIPTDYQSSKMRTEKRLDWLAECIQQYYDIHGQLPPKMDDVESVRDTWGFDKNIMPPWEKAITDGWWNPIVYQKIDETSYQLTSYGEDKKPGGMENAADIRITRNISCKAK